MAVSITNIGTASTNSGSSMSIGVSAGTAVPSKANIIIAAIGGNNPSFSDSASNSYSRTTVLLGEGAFGYATNVTAVPNGGSLSVGGILGGACAAAYVTGAGVIDSGVTGTSTGTSQPSSLTSGAPAGSGEPFFAYTFSFRNAPSNSFNNDTTNSWVNAQSSSFQTDMGNQIWVLGLSSQVNAGSSALTWAPSFSQNGTEAGSTVIAFLVPVVWQGTSVYSGTGSLSALCKLVLQGAQTFGATGAMISTGTLNELTTGVFGGTGSLSYQGNLGLIASANFSEIVPPIPTLSALATISGMVASEFDGAGNLSCDSGTAPPGGFVAILNGTGSLSASVQQFSAAILRFNGTGGLTAVPALHISVSAMFNGMSHMSLPNFAIIDFLASGSLSVDTIYRPRMGFFTGFGSLSASAFRIIHVSHRFAGAGRMDAQAIVRKGRGGVTANTVQSGPGTSFNITVAGG